MTEGGLTRTPAATQQGAAAEPLASSDRDAQAHAEPSGPAVPLSLLALARDESWPADELLWEWGRWEPTSPFDATSPEGEPEWSPVADRPGPGPEEVEPAQETVADETAKSLEPQVSAPTVVAAEASAGPPAPSTAQPGPQLLPGPEAGEAAEGEGPAREDADASSLETGGIPQWSARVRSAVGRRIRVPSPSDPEGLERPLREPVEAVRRREAARRAGAVPSLKKSLPKDPALPVQLPTPKPIPVPEAEQLVTEATGLVLTEQVLPVLQEYTYVPTTGRRAGKPQPVKAQVGAGLPPMPGMKVEPIPPPKPPKLGKKELAAIKAAHGEIAKAPVAEGAFRLTNLPAPGTAKAPPLPPVSKTDITGVLVRLRNSVETDAAKLLSGVRESMYSGTLAHYFKGLGDAEFLPELRSMITQAVDSIASQAGIDLEVLHTATLTADGKVELQKEKEQATVGAAGEKARSEIKGEGETSAKTDIGAQEQFEDETHAKITAAPGTFDPANILLHRDALIRRVLRRLAPEDLRHEREGTERLNALTVLEGAYIQAYRQVSDEVAKRIKRDTEAASGPKAKSGKGERPAVPKQAPTPTSAQAPPPAPSAAPATPAEAWAMARWDEVRRAFVDLRKKAEQSTKANRGKVFAARWRSGELIRDWADRQVGDRIGDYDRVMERLRSWGKERETASKVWEEVRLASLYVDLQGDLTFVGELEADEGRRAQAKAMGNAKMLSNAQQAIVDEYFAKDPPRDPLSAVAAGMRARITEARAPRLKEQLDAMLYKQPPDNWDAVAKVAESEGGDVVIKERGDKFWAAVDQWGTDEDKVYAALTGLTKLQRFALDLWYQKKHGSTIEAELKDEMEDEELDRARALLEGDEVAAAAAAIRDAIVGPGTDEELIYSQLRNKTAEQRAQIEAIYLSRYKTSLTKDLESDLGGEELARAKALQVGDVKRADAIGLEYAKSSKWYGGPDTDAIQKIYAQNRAELEDDARVQHWTADQLREKVLERNKAIDAEHKKEYKGEGLRASFETGLRGPARELALGLHDQDWKKADAARLELERRSFITDDKVVNQILESQYTRARKEITLDKEHNLAYRRDLAMLRGEAKLWDEKKQRADMAAAIDKESKERGVEYMDDLKATYDTAYKDDPIYKVNGRGGFDNLINDHLMGSDKDRAKALVAGGGYLTPVQEIQFAVQGPGTNLDVVKQQLAGKSPKQIEQLEKDWQLLHKDDEPQPYPTLRSRVMEEVSGRDSFDVGLLLEGEPQDPKAKLERAKKKRDYEKSAYLLGNTFSEREAGELDEEVAKLEKTVQQLHDLQGLGVLTEAQTKEADLLRWEVDQRVRSVDSAVEEHRRSVDWLADTIAMVAAVAVGILVTAVTGGLAGLVLGAIAAAEATVLAKLAVKGGAYTDEELLVDVATGVVDAVLAIPTAKMGGLLLRTAAKGMPIGPLAKLATSASRTKRMIAHGLQNSVEGFLGGVASGTVGALADERTWNNPDVLGSVTAAGSMGGLMGAGIGGGMGSLGGIKRFKGPHLDPGRPPDLDAAAKAFDEAQRAGAGLDDQGVRQARAAQWQTHQAQHPSASYADFLADLEAGRIAPDPAGPAKFGSAAREALASGLPPGDRAVLGGVAVHVLSDAEFSRMTRSESGQAVTIVRDGKPVVLMRESAPIRALREEGIHAAQILDPRFAGQAKLLDESLMARWGSLDLKTKMDMYRAKLDLELDAHAKLLKGLRDQIDESPPGLARNALVDQADAARHNMAALFDRRVELASFGPLDRLAARFGRGKLASRLEQAPRLFNKTAKATKKVKAGRPAKPAKKGKAAPPTTAVSKPKTKPKTQPKAKPKAKAKAKAKAKKPKPPPIDPDAPYPGARPELIDRATAAPVKDSPHPDGGVWKERVVSVDEIVPMADVEGRYWSFPELRPGEVLVLPSGTRVWHDPELKMIMEEHPVGRSVSSQRGRTRGEDVLFLPEDVGPSAAGMQRLHGAASPGLGFDSPYSIARGSKQVNLAIENSGIELWVRRLRSNAPSGVQYVFTTGTARTPRGDLTGRIYKVSAIVDGRLVDLASFRVDVGPPAKVELTSAPNAALVEHGFPPLRPKSPLPSGAQPRPIDLPKGLLQLLGFEVKAPKRIKRPTIEAAAELSQRLRENIERITEYRKLRGQSAEAAALEDLVPVLERLEDVLRDLPSNDPRVARAAKALNDLRDALHRRRSKIPNEQRVLRQFRDAVENVFDDE